MSYQDYLNSAHWQKLRQKVLQRDGYKCMFCNKTKGLQVHHNIYRERLEDAELTDLVTLCKYHHARQHGIIKGRKKTFRQHKEPTHISVVLKSIMLTLEACYVR